MKEKCTYFVEINYSRNGKMKCERICLNKLRATLMNYLGKENRCPFLAHNQINCEVLTLHEKTMFKDMIIEDMNEELNTLIKDMGKIEKFKFKISFFKIVKKKNKKYII